MRREQPLCVNEMWGSLGGLCASAAEGPPLSQGWTVGSSECVRRPLRIKKCILGHQWHFCEVLGVIEGPVLAHLCSVFVELHQMRGEHVYSGFWHMHTHK